MRMHQLTAARSAICALALVCAAGGTAAAQWLSLPVPGTPRTPDGKPNLNAPAPRTADGKPDHSGIWKLDTSGHNPNYNLLAKGVEAPMLPWAAELYKQRVATHGYDRPMTVCLPHGVPDGLTSPYGFKLIQTPFVTVHLYEEFTKYRQIHTDGRKLPDDPDLEFHGTSVGRWEGDTLVVETIGFSPLTEIIRGVPHGGSMRIVERFRLTDPDTMTIQTTVTDQAALASPYVTNNTLRRHRDWTIAEYICEENNRNSVDTAGKAGIDLSIPGNPSKKN